jgi:hypothetical protein
MRAVEAAPGVPGLGAASLYAGREEVTAALLRQEFHAQLDRRKPTGLGLDGGSAEFHAPSASSAMPLRNKSKLMRRQKRSSFNRM